MQALRAAARDGVDVRLLVPGRGSDIAVMQSISRAGYRPLLEAGVRVFEWNGPMLHAKTAVADGALVPHRLHEPQPRELDRQLGARRGGRGRARSRRAMEAMYLDDLGERDGDRHHAEEHGAAHEPALGPAPNWARAPGR